MTKKVYKNMVPGGAYKPVGGNGTTPSICHSEGVKRVEESSQVASFILCWFFFQRGGFLHSAGARGLNDKMGGRVLFFVGNGSVLSGAIEKPPWLSLWESWLGAAETERAVRRLLNNHVH